MYEPALRDLHTIHINVLSHKCLSGENEKDDLIKIGPRKRPNNAFKSNLTFMRYVLQLFYKIIKILGMSDQLFLNRTRKAYVATRVLDTPFWALYNMLPVILYKDLHATPFQLALLIALKPLVSLLSTYWSSRVNSRRDRLVSNILYARIFGYLPFFLFPFTNNLWFFIASFGLYMMFAVGMVPAWMEILKLNIPKNTREKVFSYTQAFGYMGGGLLPFALGWILDGQDGAWRWLFPLAASFALLSFFFQYRLLIPMQEGTPSPPSPTHQLLRPWKSAWDLLRARRDFRQFQMGSMLIGCGLMIVQPALPIFFVDTLQLSYTEIAVALTLCKGLGFAAASPLWSRWINTFDIFRLTSIIAVLGAVFPLCLFLTQGGMGWLWLGYLCYGVMQSGNELIWNLSGATFAGEEDSSTYTNVNILSIGLRGCMIPFLGGLLASSLGASAVMLLSGTLFLFAILPLSTYYVASRKKVRE